MLQNPLNHWLSNEMQKCLLIFIWKIVVSLCARFYQPTINIFPLRWSAVSGESVTFWSLCATLRCPSSLWLLRAALRWLLRTPCVPIQRETRWEQTASSESVYSFIHNLNLDVGWSLWCQNKPFTGCKKITQQCIIGELERTGWQKAGEAQKLICTNMSTTSAGESVNSCSERPNAKCG